MKKSKNQKPKRDLAPPATTFEPSYWYVFRVNNKKTIFKLMRGKHINQAEAEAEASKLDLIGVVNGKSDFYIALDGAAALHLWIGYDVRR